MMRIVSTLRLAVCLSSTLAVFSASGELLPPPTNVVNLDVSASEEVASDTLSITLYVEEQGADAAAVAGRVNAALAEALAAAKSEAAVVARSGGYQTLPIYDRAGQITAWRARAELVIESRDFRAAGALAGRLQATLKLAGTQFTLSKAKREEIGEHLQREALAKFQMKAEAISRALGFGGFTYREITVRTEGVPRPIPFNARAGLAAAPAEPARPVPLEPSKDTVTVAVTGSIVMTATSRQ